MLNILRVVLLFCRRGLALGLVATGGEARSVIHAVPPSRSAMGHTRAFDH